MLILGRGHQFFGLPFDMATPDLTVVTPTKDACLLIG